MQKTAGNQAVLSLLQRQSRPVIQRTLSPQISGVVKQWKEKVLAYIGDPLGPELSTALNKQEAVDVSPAVADPAVKKIIAELEENKLKAHLKQENLAAVTAAHAQISKQLSKATSDYSDEIRMEGKETFLKAGSITLWRCTDAMTARGYILSGIPVTNNAEGKKKLGVGFYTATEMIGAISYDAFLQGLPTVLELQLTRDAKILCVKNTDKTADKSGLELQKLTQEYDGLADAEQRQYKFHQKLYQTGLNIVAVHVKEGRDYKKYTPDKFVEGFEAYLSGKHQEAAKKRQVAEEAAKREKKEKEATPFIPSQALLSAPNAPDWAVRYIKYQEAAEQFEKRLGEFAAQHKGAAAEVDKLVKAAWQLLQTDREKFGTRLASTTGMVGTELRMIQQVVDSGNLREQLAFLYNGYTGRAFEKKFGVEAFKRPDVLEAERAQRRDRILIPRAGEGAVTPATTLNPYEAQPPLSSREWYAAVDKTGKLSWEPGERLYEMKTYHKPNEVENPAAQPAPFEQLAEITGALTKTGTSGTAYGFLQAAVAIGKETKTTIDFFLFRLALIGGMLPVGDHTFHEVMLACQLFNPELKYANSHLRYRLLAPLTEDELRALAPDKRFPDELLEQGDISYR